jgi:alpha-L-fucosidase 2
MKLLPQYVSLTFSDLLGLSLPRCTLCQSVEIWATQFLLAVSHLVALTGSAPSGSAPSGFPLSGNGLWFTKSADSWVREWLPVGNGYLAGNHIEVDAFYFLVLTIGSHGTRRNFE